MRRSRKVCAAVCAAVSEIVLAKVERGMCAGGVSGACAGGGTEWEPVLCAGCDAVASQPFWNSDAEASISMRDCDLTGIALPSSVTASNIGSASRVRLRLRSCAPPAHGLSQCRCAESTLETSTKSDGQVHDMGDQNASFYPAYSSCPSCGHKSVPGYLRFRAPSVPSPQWRHQQRARQASDLG